MGRPIIRHSEPPADSPSCGLTKEKVFRSLMNREVIDGKYWAKYRHNDFRGYVKGLWNDERYSGRAFFLRIKLETGEEVTGRAFTDD
jgi:hypothetical protein